MSTYAIGDIQGCLDELLQLLEKIGFDARRDRLWFTGDLINRGPKSAATLRFIRGLGEAAVTVLGNHDIFLLMLAAGHGKLHRGDTMQEIFDQPDRDELLAWVRSRPVAHLDDGYLLVHAGVLPQWSAAKAVELAREVEHALMHDPSLLANLRGFEPNAWREDLAGHDRLRLLINAFTRMRFITPMKKDGSGGEMEFATKTDAAPAGYLAWYEEPMRATRDVTVIYGHWASRGLVLRENVAGIDTGCVWGRDLTALRLEDRKLFQVPCAVGQRGYGSNEGGA
jgi:bis(5'-nucleosyl)-tetraphosphatase (symmetrical)